MFYRVRTLVVILVICCVAARSLCAAEPSAGEMATAKRWTAQHLEPKGTVPPFSFVYDGKASADFLKTWTATSDTRKLDKHRLRRVLTYTDAKTGLVLRCVAVEYLDYPTVEWTLYFKNTGATDTPVLSDIAALDTRLIGSKKTEFTLHGIAGDDCTALSYKPLDAVLGPGSTKRLTAVGGRPTNGNFPYFNIEGPGEGVIVAVSWAGQWAAEFSRDQAEGLRLRGGQELTHFKLHPGEEVRTPMAVMQFYKGDVIRAQNIWRGWMVKHNLPRIDGKPLRPLLSMCDGNSFPGLLTSEAGEKQFIDGYVKLDLKLDFWWIDAGWFRVPADSWYPVGTWEIEKKRYPNGIKAISDYVHQRGMKLIVWFEPERVAAGSWLAMNHPEWVLGGKEGGLLNLGDPIVWKWVVNHFDGLLTSQGIDYYRQDFNIDPLAYWRGNDTPDRQGITEIKHVMAYYAYWDELLRRHPGMLIDSCASGGRRNDLETLRRGVPLLRSDYQGEPVGNQGHTYGLSLWFPFYGTGVVGDSAYRVRSHICPAFAIAIDPAKEPAQFALVRKMVADWRKVAEYLLCDYYPLTPYRESNNVWMAWQFDSPEQGGGMVQAFRRAENQEGSIRLKLRGLRPAATYLVTDLDGGKTERLTGRELMEPGLRIVSPESPVAKLITYKKVK